MCWFIFSVGAEKVVTPLHFLGKPNVFSEKNSIIVSSFRIRLADNKLKYKFMFPSCKTTFNQIKKKKNKVFPYNFYFITLNFVGNIISIRIKMYYKLTSMWQLAF